MRLIINEGGPDLTERYFREIPGGCRTHIPGRCRGSWSEQGAPLFRDYLRLHEDDARACAALKHRLAGEYRDDRRSYTEGKASFIWEIMCEPTGGISASDGSRVSQMPDVKG